MLSNFLVMIVSRHLGREGGAMDVSPDTNEEAPMTATDTSTSEIYPA